MFKSHGKIKLGDDDKVVYNPASTERELSSQHAEGICVCKSFLGTCIHKTESNQTSDEAMPGEL